MSQCVIVTEPCDVGALAREAIQACEPDEEFVTAFFGADELFYDARCAIFDESPDMGDEINGLDMLLEMVDDAGAAGSELVVVRNVARSWPDASEFYKFAVEGEAYRLRGFAQVLDSPAEDGSVMVEEKLYPR